MSTEMGRAASTVTAVNTRPSAVNTYMLVYIVLAAPSSSLSPILMPSSTVVPIVRPVHMPLIMSMVWLPVRTADTSAALLKRPTAHRSNAP